MSVIPADTVPVDTVPQAAKFAPKRWSLNNATAGDTLDLSESRTYDCALDVRRAYRLTGNFCVDLQIVLDDLGVLDQVTYQIKPKALMSDCRRVEFLPKHHVHAGRFAEILRSISGRIGAEPTPPFWARLFR